MNSLVIEGYVGNIGEVKQFPNGSKVISFSFAESRIKDDVEPVWFNVQAWDNQCDIVQKILQKGSYLTIFGEFKPRYYVKDNIKHTVLDINLIRFKKINIQHNTTGGGNQNNATQPEIKSNIPDYKDIEDDLPF